MGAGYHLSIVNGTSHKWVRTNQSSYQMSSDSKSWPDYVEAFTALTLYIEFSNAAGDFSIDDEMWADYRIEGTSSYFRMWAANKFNDSKFHCWLSGMSTLSDPMDATVNIGSNTGDLGTTFIMTGIDGAWVTSSGGAIGPWMTQSMNYIGERALRQICLPCSHDSGMALLGKKTPLASAATVVTQHRHVGDQLRLGIRFFDIRPVKWGDVLYCGHVTYTNDFTKWQGGMGESIDDVINQVNDFTNDNHELIILNISHDCDSDNSYNGLNDDSWNNLLGKFDNLKHLYSAESNTDLSKIPMKTFIGGGQATVILRFESGADKLRGRLGKGFFPSSCMPIFDQYANSDDPDKLVADQFKKLNEQRSSPDNNMFSLDWAMTMQGFSDVLFSNLLHWADLSMTPRLGINIFPKTSKTVYPNVINVDGVQNTDPVAISIAMNVRAVLG
ncbi:MAG: hypothetical protein M1821_004625 [Bathelium mastoideum]|nr:MAG: hypothetical protein M1821_004625 [Bathelium mastoideum]